MSELDHIRKRIEQAELRLRTSHSARERESATLQRSWEQIRDKIAAQNAEMAVLHTQIASLQDSRAELLAMVDTLLRAVEGGLDKINDETVPHIAEMAAELLAEESAAPAVPDMPAALDLPELTDDPEEFDDEPASFAAEMEAALDREALLALQDQDEPADLGESMSPGIRDLITRIEGSFPAVPAGLEDEDDDEDGDELTRDLREIEALRNELNGLRARISADKR